MAPLIVLWDLEEHTEAREREYSKLNHFACIYRCTNSIRGRNEKLFNVAFIRMYLIFTQSRWFYLIGSSTDPTH